MGSTPGAPSIPAWQRAVTSTERTRTTSSLADSSEMPVSTESSDSKELSKVSSFEQSAMNGRSDFFTQIFVYSILHLTWKIECLIIISSMLLSVEFS